MINGETDMVQKEVIKTNKAPLWGLPFSQAIKVGQFVFVSGQVPADPKTLETVGGDIKAQVKRVLENLRAILEAAGASLENVVKVTVFLRDIKYFDQLNEVYSQYFKKDMPARSCVEAKISNGDTLVEIEAIAVLPT